MPRGVRHPAGFEHVAWHSFAAPTFEIGRIEIDGHPDLRMYSAERTIVDSYRLAHLEGLDTAHEALRRWIRRPDSSPAALLRVAGLFPRTMSTVREALQVLL